MVLCLSSTNVTHLEVQGSVAHFHLISYTESMYRLLDPTQQSHTELGSPEGCPVSNIFERANASYPGFCLLSPGSSPSIKPELKREYRDWIED